MFLSNLKKKYVEARDEIHIKLMKIPGGSIRERGKWSNKKYHDQELERNLLVGKSKALEYFISDADQDMVMKQT
jgi:hypothetical protein